MSRWISNGALGNEKSDKFNCMCEKMISLTACVSFFFFLGGVGGGGGGTLRLEALQYRVRNRFT